MSGANAAGRPAPNVVRQARGGGNRRGFLLALLVIAVVGVGAISWAMQRKRAASGPIVIPETVANPNAPRPEGYVRGSATAPVEIVEYADFECPGCAQFAAVTEPDVRTRLVDAGLARFRFYDFQVIPQHQNSPAASLAAACAADQGKFWEMHDRIFAGQNDWNAQVTDNPRAFFVGYATALGLDNAKFAECYDSRRHLDRLAAHRAEAARAGVRATPTIIVGTRKLEGPSAFDAIRALVDSARGGPAAAPAAR